MNIFALRLFIVFGITKRTLCFIIIIAMMHQHHLQYLQTIEKEQVQEEDFGKNFIRIILEIAKLRKKIKQ